MHINDEEDNFTQKVDLQDWGAEIPQFVKYFILLKAKALYVSLALKCILINSLSQWQYEYYVSSNNSVSSTVCSVKFVLL